MIKIQQQTERFGDYTDVDTDALALVATRLSISYSHAAQLSLTVIAPDYSAPIPRLAFVRVWDDGFQLADGETDQDEDHPLFEGFVEVVAPAGDSNRVQLACYDATYRVVKELITMSLPWDAGIDGNPPTPAAGAIPRLILNVSSESDSDYPFERSHGLTIGGFIAIILDDQLQPLWWLNAAPDGPLQAYVDADLEGMDFVPQEKIVWETESVRASTERLQRFDPRYRLLWEPGSRLWRFFNITDAPSVTLTLNDPTVDFPVLSLDLSPSFERAWTAIKIYGPPTTETEEFIWYRGDVIPDGWTNTLAPVGSAIELETIGIHEISTYSAWQIVDSTKRRGARLLPDWFALRMSEFIWDNVKEPQFLLSWDGGQTWIGAEVFLDFQTGQAIFQGTVPFATVDQQYGQTAEYVGQHYFPPNAAKLVYAKYVTSLSVRVPETGFEGTAYTVAGMEVEKAVYDDSLAIGYEYGNPVTSEDRIAAMAALGRAQLDRNKDIVWTGGCVLDGIDYSWSRLNRRVNFVANDGNGGTVATGWDAIDAWVTDVDYDYAERTTTLTFSSDRQELIGEDVAQLKQRLNIKALEQRQWSESELLFRTNLNWRGDTYREISGVLTNSGFEYVDPQSGMTVYKH